MLWITLWITPPRSHVNGGCLWISHRLQGPRIRANRYASGRFASPHDFHRLSQAVIADGKTLSEVIPRIVPTNAGSPVLSLGRRRTHGAKTSVLILGQTAVLPVVNRAEHEASASRRRSQNGVSREVAHLILHATSGYARAWFEGEGELSAHPIAIWNSVMSSLRETIPDSRDLTWLAEARPLSLVSGALSIGVRDALTKEGIESRYRGEIERLASHTCESPVSLVVRVIDAATFTTSSAADAPDDNGVLGSCIPLSTEYSFDTFVRGKNNHLAHAASEAVARAVVDDEEKTYNPLFIYGNVGLGKTHLLHAIGNWVKDAALGQNIVYTTSERFAIELIDSIRHNATGTFRGKFRRVDLLMIDDVQFLEGKEATQEELFHTFNELYGRAKQIVLSSDRPPEALSGLQERLVSRFKMGLVADIQAPDLETRIAILREKAIARNLDVDDHILEIIARRISSNVRALEGALNRALASAQLQGERLTPQKLELVLPKEGRRPRLTIEAIKEEVATHFSMNRKDLESASRKKEITRARQVAIFLAREMTDHSFPAIGREFGNRDHTTIMHSYVKVKSQVSDAPLLYAEIDELRESLASRFAVLT